MTDEDDDEINYMTMPIPGIDEEEEKKEKRENVIVSAAERLEVGLSTSVLDPESKGLKIMQKMGFNPEKTKGLGHGEKGSSEPIKIELKRGRYGIGHKKARKLNSIDSDEISDFRLRKTRENQEKIWLIELKKIQNQCMRLDDFDIESFKGNWRDVSVFYRGLREDKQERMIDEIDEDEDEDLEIFENQTCHEKFNEIYEFLKKSYNYCYWCSCYFDEEHSGSEHEANKLEWKEIKEDEI